MIKTSKTPHCWQNTRLLLNINTQNTISYKNLTKIKLIKPLA